MNTKSGSIAILVIVLAVLAAPILYTISSNASSTGKNGDLNLVIPAEAGTKCIEDTAYMRANHMILLKHTRDDVVREGIRKISHSLHNCSSCHTKREEFCDKCHNYVGANPECFDCHKYE